MLINQTNKFVLDLRLVLGREGPMGFGCQGRITQVV